MDTHGSHGDAVKGQDVKGWIHFASRHRKMTPFSVWRMWINLVYKSGGEKNILSSFMWGTGVNRKLVARLAEVFRAHFLWAASNQSFADDLRKPTPRKINILPPCVTAQLEWSAPHMFPDSHLIHPRSITNASYYYNDNQILRISCKATNGHIARGSDCF